jgi:hypothetical protein
MALARNSTRGNSAIRRHTAAIPIRRHPYQSLLTLAMSVKIAAGRNRISCLGARSPPWERNRLSRSAADLRASRRTNPPRAKSVCLASSGILSVGAVRHFVSLRGGRFQEAQCRLPGPTAEAIYTPTSDVGVWLSLVEHLVRDEGVAGSNPATPTNKISHLGFYVWRFRAVFDRHRLSILAPRHTASILLMRAEHTINHP